MKLLLCFVFVYALRVYSKPIDHKALGPEMECLKKYPDISDKIIAEFYSVIPPEDEVVGEYFICTLKKRQILKDNGKIDFEKIYKYWVEVYRTTISSDSEEKEIRDAAKECAKLKDDRMPILALKIKNCVLEGALRVYPKSKPINDKALGPEVECLKNHPHISGVIINEAVGEFFICTLKKRQILEDNGKINPEKIYKFWVEVYQTTINSDSEERTIRDAAEECAKLKDDKMPILALKIMYCILQFANK